MFRYVFFLYVFMIGILPSCSLQKGQKIILTNTSDVQLKGQAVTAKRKDFANVSSGKLYPLVTNGRGDTLAAQLDDLDGDKEWDELFFVTDLAAKGRETFNVKWVRSQLNFEKKTSIRFGVRQTLDSKVEPAISDTFYADQLPAVIGYQHYQTDGPTWENDKVGFRLYLDGRNSIDVFGKTKKEITPGDVGIGEDGVTENNYSVMKDWGTDILGVANSVGIGGISLLVGDSLFRLGVTEQDPLNNVDTTIFKIISEGPVRSTMKFTYKNWRPVSHNYFVESTTSIWPGLYGFSNSVRFNNLKGDETLVVGLVNSNTNKQLTEIILDKWVVLLTHDKQSINKEWWLGLALILPKSVYSGYMQAPKAGRLSNTYLGKLKVENNKPVNYYAIAGWELSNNSFKDSTYFTKYVTDLVKQLESEVEVSVK